MTVFISLLAFKFLIILVRLMFGVRVRIVSKAGMFPRELETGWAAQTKGDKVHSTPLAVPEPPQSAMLS